MPKPFLNTVAETTLKLNVPIENVCVLFPNRRAEVFFRRYLSELSEEALLAPLLYTAEEFVTQLTGIYPLNGNALLFATYETYLKLDLKGHDTFEDFMKWANTALYDFNEIDRHLVDADELFENMVSAKTIERWGAETEGAYALVDRFLDIWKTFKPLYHKLKAKCLTEKMGWQGLAYRTAAEDLSCLDRFCKEKNIQHFVFAGFNALNKAEETLIEHLLKENKCTVLWDADRYYLDNTNQEAGQFIRERMESWQRYPGSKHVIEDNLLKDKIVHIYSTGGSLEQAQNVGHILNKQNTEASNTAVVLADENLLMPVLNSIPDYFSEVNVTMGMGLRQSNAAMFVATALKVKNKVEAKPTIYFRDLNRILEFGPAVHSFGVEGRSKCKQILDELNRQNMVFISEKELLEIFENKECSSPFILELFDKKPPVEFLRTLVEALTNFAADVALSKVEKEIYFNVVSLVQSLDLELVNANLDLSYTVVVDLLKTALSTEQVSFYGEPLMGLQIMGILETRTLDFDNLILTTVNEGVLPSGKSNNSFIPYDIRRYFEMPVHNERDAIYAYHFFRLLQRAKTVHLIYNNTTGGIGGKEKSRFIRQIESEWPLASSSVTIMEKESSISIKDESLEKFSEVIKSEALKADILAYLQKGVTPTSLSLYVKNPLEFYYSKILRVNEENDIEETVGYATLGTVVHDVLEDLYSPFVGGFPAKEDFEKMQARLQSLLDSKFREHYGKGQLEQGKNLLVMQVAKTMVTNFLKKDQETGNEWLLKGEPIKILSLEEALERTLFVEALSIHVKFKGFADRIEKRGNDIYITDYKTGAVEQKDLDVKELSDIFNPDKGKEKVLQLLLYAYMFDKNQLNGGNVYGAVFSLRKFSQGAMLAKINGLDGKKQTLIFDQEREQELEDLLVLKICELHEGGGSFEDISLISLQ